MFAISTKEIKEFVSNFTKDQYEKVVHFFSTSPKLEHKVKYKTNYPQAEVHGKLFKPIIKQINEKLAKDNISFELSGEPWYAEYGEHDYHAPHIHATTCPVDEARGFQKGENYYNYSGIICLSNFGETSFINPNPSSSTSEIIELPSKYNRAILFPSNIYHYVIPHGLRDQTRAIFSFNCELKLGSFNANI